MNQGTSNYQKFLKKKAKSEIKANVKKSLFKNNKIRYIRKVCTDRGKNIPIELKNLKISKGKIIELGCNSGKNLEILRKQGYKDLTGIDVNKYAIERMKKVYPELYKITSKKIGLIENITDTINDIYDLSFTIAVLIHINSKERSKIYKWLSDHSRYIIFIEKNFGGIKLEEGRIIKNNIYPRDELEKLGFEFVKFSNLNNVTGLTKYKMLVMKNTKIL